ncbi:Exocyst complex component SEC5A [Camellia lanceoleosa]|uniref:Exocyst complex component SEC5A n=1 Tax=Camellia lanceoleosa TaxID=1840588 RepID=A0ACC0GB99_9ERIC|nr:Exocyst complex component SEC5A [Camellia lanceoleosa]
MNYLLDSGVQWGEEPAVKGVRDAAIELLHTLVAVHAEVFAQKPLLDKTLGILVEGLIDTFLSLFHENKTKDLRSLDANGLCRLMLEGTPGVARSMLWDGGVVLEKFLEHAVESGMMLLQGNKVVELGSGCGLVGCIVALLGADVILTNLPYRLRLLRKNVGTNLYGNIRRFVVASQVIWGEKPIVELIRSLPNYVRMRYGFIGHITRTLWHPNNNYFGWRTSKWSVSEALRDRPGINLEVLLGQEPCFTKTLGPGIINQFNPGSSQPNVWAVHGPILLGSKSSEGHNTGASICKTVSNKMQSTNNNGKRKVGVSNSISMGGFSGFVRRLGHGGAGSSKASHKGVVVRSVAAAMLKSASNNSQHSGSRGELHEAQLTLMLGKRLGVDCLGQDEAAIQQLVRMEEVDKERIGEVVVGAD